MRNTEVIFKDLPKSARLYIAELEARVARLEQELANYRKIIEQKDEKIAELESKCERLEFQNAKLIADKYGTSSEKVVTMGGVGLNIVGDEDIDATITLTDEEIKRAIDLNKPKVKKKPKPLPRKKIPAHIPRVIDKLDIQKADRKCPCGGLMYKIGELESEKIRYTPARLEVVKFIRPKYACRTCYEHVIKVPLPKNPIKNSFAHMILY